MVRNAIKYKPSGKKRGRKPAMSAREVKSIVRYSKQFPFAAATEIKDALKVSSSIETVRWRLREHDLGAHSPRKVPLLTKTHVEKRLRFAKEHINWPATKWRNILWSDESKIVLCGGKGSRQYVRRPPNTEYQPKYTTKTIKHGGSSIMVWACFSWLGVGPIHWVKEMMTGASYVDILKDIMLPYARDEMPLVWTFQQDNDPKHTCKVAKRWFEESQINVMEWPPQSPDINPIENLWVDVKEAVAQRKPTSNTQL